MHNSPPDYIYGSIKRISLNSELPSIVQSSLTGHEQKLLALFPTTLSTLNEIKTSLQNVTDLGTMKQYIIDDLEKRYTPLCSYNHPTLVAEYKTVCTILYGELKTKYVEISSYVSLAQFLRGVKEYYRQVLSQMKDHGYPPQVLLEKLSTEYTTRIMIAAKNPYYPLLDELDYLLLLVALQETAHLSTRFKQLVEKLNLTAPRPWFWQKELEITREQAQQALLMLPRI